jgi:YVTN family beta-propeller protein
MSGTLGRTLKVALRRAVVYGCVVVGMLSLAGCRRHRFPTYPANYREYLYVANSGSNTVTAIDVVHLRLDREITVGVHPIAVLASKSRHEVYVLNSGAVGSESHGSGSVTFLDVEHQRVTATVDVGPDPVAFALSPDDRLAYVASAGRSSLVVVDLLHRRIAANLSLSTAPTQVAVAPDGRTVLVSSAAEGSLITVAADELESRWSVRARISGCPGADSMAVLPDSSKGFVACSRGHQLMAVRLAWQREMAAGRSEARADALEALLNVGQKPSHLALKPDGGELFVSNAGSNSISEVVTFSDDVGGTYLIGSMPEFGVVSADNSLLYESSSQSQQIAVYSIDDGRRQGSIHVGDGPDQLAFSASGYLLFALDRRSGDVAAIRTDTQSMFTFFAVGRAPVAIADKNFTIQ